ncbi:peroxidase family protein [Peribacillus butanolivorans]|uniref:Peroxidase n=1 Tax=Peribacillus butanolivorans TaxID=421767 RepID=A0ABN5N8R5_9BACI|nr:peroxidase family protein [Peribacillus butanolivorans]AXN41062.1 peroxidase [Peribacillus butanolivorans]
MNIDHSSPNNRSYDGTANNLQHPQWGSVGETFYRLTSFAYDDGVSAPSGVNRPNARLISNTLCKQIGSIMNHRGLSDLTGVWALFLSHTLQSFRAAEPEEQFGIFVPEGDPVFEPGTTIPLARWLYDVSTGREPGKPRLQINNTSSYLDASVIYGIDFTRAGALREFKNGAMKVSEGNLLPLNIFGLPNRVPGPNFFLAGDERANTSFGLCALHTLFVREHNRLANEMVSTNPNLSDEAIYQRVRKIVGAQIQVITYNEFLPALLGSNFPSGSEAYDSNGNATISEIFSVVGFRFGHSMLSPYFDLLYDNGDRRLILQRNSFFNIDVIKRDGLNPIFRGLVSQVMQEIDEKVIDDIRNQTIRFNVKIDLLAYDIQSARDFGIPDYNKTRQDMGLPPVRSFAEITSNVQLQNDLQNIYGDINHIDPLIGGLAEDHLPDSSLGPLLTAIIVEQFKRLQNCDRFWYENDPAFSEEDITHLKKTTLAEIIRRNTGIRDIQDDVFFVASK